MTSITYFANDKKFMRRRKQLRQAAMQIRSGGGILTSLLEPYQLEWLMEHLSDHAPKIENNKIVLGSARNV